MTPLLAITLLITLASAPALLDAQAATIEETWRRELEEHGEQGQTVRDQGGRLVSHRVIAPAFGTYVLGEVARQGTTYRERWSLPSGIVVLERAVVYSSAPQCKRNRWPVLMCLKQRGAGTTRQLDGKLRSKESVDVRGVRTYTVYTLEGARFATYQRDQRPQLTVHNSSAASRVEPCPKGSVPLLRGPSSRGGLHEKSSTWEVSIKIACHTRAETLVGQETIWRHDGTMVVEQWRPNTTEAVLRRRVYDDGGNLRYEIDTDGEQMIGACRNADGSLLAQGRLGSGNLQEPVPVGEWTFFGPDATPTRTRIFARDEFIGATPDARADVACAFWGQRWSLSAFPPAAGDVPPATE